MKRSASDPRSQLEVWFAGQIPDGWFCRPPEVTFDHDEILVVGTLPDAGCGGGDLPEEVRYAAEAAAIERFRQATREPRIGIAEGAEARFRRKVSWGARCGDTTEYFTITSVPVMTRLRMGERAVLDTLIDAGVARSRSEALAWCVRLVGRNEAEWIANLRAAFEQVETIRARGPRSDQARGPVDDA